METFRYVLPGGSTGSHSPCAVQTSTQRLAPPSGPANQPSTCLHAIPRDLRLAQRARCTPPGFPRPIQAPPGRFHTAQVAGFGDRRRLPISRTIRAATAMGRSHRAPCVFQNFRERSGTASPVPGRPVVEYEGQEQRVRQRIPAVEGVPRLEGPSMWSSRASTSSPACPVSECSRKGTRRRAVPPHAWFQRRASRPRRCPGSAPEGCP